MRATSSNRTAPTEATPPWAESEALLLAQLGASPSGLSAAEAAARLARDGPNRLHAQVRVTALAAFGAQFKSPLVLILVFAAFVAVLTQDWIDATIVLAIIVASATLSFAQEYRAGRAIEALLARTAPRAAVLRDGRRVDIAAHEVVTGDVVCLSAGDLIPADARVLAADDFFVNQAVLTGETFPAEKTPGVAAAGASLTERTNVVFLGTNVRSGSARVLVFATAAATEYGRIADTLALRAPETEFERGIRQFGTLLTQVMTLLVLGIFAANVALERPVVEALLFAVAIAVGLAPELLPAIISITLARGAQHLAKHGVLVRRLAAIENLGSMDILATDKTGTLTTGDVRLDAAYAVDGKASARVLELAVANAALQTGLVNPLDRAIVERGQRDAVDISRYTKSDEVPYDFVRKRLTIAVRASGRSDDLLITKGALDAVLACCVSKRDGVNLVPMDAGERQRLGTQAAEWQDQGIRVLGLASREAVPARRYTSADEVDLVFEGFLLFADPPKPDAGEAIARLQHLGVKLKIVTGDSRRVALHVAQQVGLRVDAVLTGAELAQMHDEALWHAAARTTIFAEVDPNQKEKIIAALRRTGHVVGYLGDGINDAPALHMADVGISVDNAVDVARQTADFVLLEHSLTLLSVGIEEGRRVFANTLKYVFTTTSANFGNMVSMAAVSVLLPFLPLLPKQILLNNFLSDIPAMAIVGDNVDRAWVARPHRWDVRFIRNFMVVFGLISSVFDLLTFALLWWVVQAAPEEFRTAWFIESLLTELVILLIVRTRKSAFDSMPSRGLWLASAAVASAAIAMPYLPPFAALFGFVPLPLPLLSLLLAITLAYAAVNEFAKRVFYRRVRWRNSRK